MKKRFFIAALLALTLIFGNITVFAENVPDTDVYTEDEYYDDEYYDDEYYDDEYYDNNYYNDEYYDSHSGIWVEYGQTIDDEKTFYKNDYYLDETVYYCDESERFTESEKQQIISLLKETSKKIGFNLAVYTGGKSRTDKATNNFTETGAKVIFGQSPKTGTVFFYVDLDGYYNAYDDMYSYREPFLYYSGMYGEDDTLDSRLDKILAQVHTKFPPSGKEIYFTDIYAGLKVFCEQLEYYKNLGPEDDIYYYNSDTNKYIYVLNGQILESETMPRPFRNWKIVLFIAVAVGAVTALIVFFSVKSSYKFKTPVSASQYTSSNKTFVNNKVDMFLGTHVSKVRIQSSSSGGSHHSGGGGGHRGGGRSGGGGGGRHR